MISLRKSILLIALVAPAISLFAMNPQENSSSQPTAQSEILQQLQASVEKNAQTTIEAMQQAIAHTHGALSEHSTPPPSKVRRVGTSPVCHDGVPSPVSPLKIPQAPHKAKSPQSPYAQNHVEKFECNNSCGRMQRARRILTFATDDRYEPVEPPQKKVRRVAARKVFTSDIVFDILQQLPQSEWPSFAGISPVCYAATQAMKEKAIAARLAKSEFGPIGSVLDKAQGNGTVKIYGTTCRTIPLLHSLLQIVDPLDDLQGNDFMPIEVDSDGVLVPQEFNDQLSGEKFRERRPTTYMTVTLEEGEEKVIEQLKSFTDDVDNADHTIALDFLDSLDIDGPYAEIKQSFIEKLAAYPITSIHFDTYRFSDGLACLAKIKSLKEVILESCVIADKTIPDAFFAGLPGLNSLTIRDSDIVSVSPAINTLKHLVVLILGVNKLQELPSLKNLTQLKVLHIYQIFNFAGEQLAQLLPATTGLLDLYLAYAGNKNPLPAGCHLNQLKTLCLDGNATPLTEHWNELKNLKELTLHRYPFTEMLAFDRDFPRLKRFNSFAGDNVTIDIDALKGFVDHLELCNFFEVAANQIVALAEISQLWQRIKDRSTVLTYRMLRLSSQTKTHYKAQLKMIKMFYHDDIKMRELRDLIGHPEQREQCVAFIDSLIEQ